MNMCKKTIEHQTLSELFGHYLSYKLEEEQLHQTIKANTMTLALLKLRIKEAPQRIGTELLDRLHVLSLTQNELQENLQNLVRQKKENEVELEHRLWGFRGKLVQLCIDKVNYIITLNDKGAGIRWYYDTGTPAIT